MQKNQGNIKQSNNNKLINDNTRIKVIIIIEKNPFCTNQVPH